MAVYLTGNIEKENMLNALLALKQEKCLTYEKLAEMSGVVKSVAVVVLQGRNKMTFKTLVTMARLFRAMGADYKQIFTENNIAQEHIDRIDAEIARTLHVLAKEQQKEKQKKTDEQQTIKYIVKTGRGYYAGVRKIIDYSYGWRTTEVQAFEQSMQKAKVIDDIVIARQLAREFGGLYLCVNVDKRKQVFRV